MRRSRYLKDRPAIFLDNPNTANLNVAYVNSRTKIKPRREHDRPNKRLLQRIEKSIMHDLFPGRSLGVGRNITTWQGEEKFYFEAESFSGVDSDGNSQTLHNIYEEPNIRDFNSLK